MELHGRSFIRVVSLATALVEPAHSQSRELGPERLTLVASPASTIRLEGDSTLHRYAASAKTIDVNASTLPPNVAPASVNDLLRHVVKSEQALSLEVRIPVASLESGTAGLDDNMHAALHGDTYPRIVMRVDSYTATPHPTIPDAFNVRAQVTLTIAGTKKSLPILAVARVAGNELQITGSAELTMSAFGIDPPTFLFGSLKTSDRVVIRFDLRLHPLRKQ